MKVDKNQRVHASNSGYSQLGGMPLRLEIASKLLAGGLANAAVSDVFNRMQDKVIALRALQLADILIAAHNETCDQE